jgi:hypothetical protein
MKAFRVTLTTPITITVEAKTKSEASLRAWDEVGPILRAQEGFTVDLPSSRE